METSRLILQRYTLREMVSPFFVGFSVVTFLLVMDLLLDYLELILEKGVPAVTVAKLFVLGLGWMVALSIPCGVLVGTLMTFGRMSQDNEILAMRSAGVSLRTILTPPFAWGAFWTIVLMLFNNYVLPWSNHEFAQTLLDINRKQPTAELDEGVFIDAFDGHRLLFDALDSRTGRSAGCGSWTSTAASAFPRRRQRAATSGTTRTGTRSSSRSATERSAGCPKTPPIPSPFGARRFAPTRS